MKFKFKLFIILILIFSIKSQEPEEKDINIKVVPARSNKLTIEDLDEVKMEILHDMNSQLKDLEDEMAEKERLKEKSSSTWAMTGAPIYIPRNPMAYFKANMMSNLQGTGNDSQKGVNFPANVQQQVSEIYKRIQAPSNKVNINYNTIREDKGTPSRVLQRLEGKLQDADMAIKELRTIRKLNGSYDEKSNLVNVGSSIFANSQVHKLQGGTVAMAMKGGGMSFKQKIKNNEEKIKNSSDKVNITKDDKNSLVKNDNHKLENNHKFKQQIQQQIQQNQQKIGQRNSLNNKVNKVNKVNHHQKELPKLINQNSNNITTNDSLNSIDSLAKGSKIQLENNSTFNLNKNNINNKIDLFKKSGFDKKILADILKINDGITKVKSNQSELKNVFKDKVINKDKLKVNNKKNNLKKEEIKSSFKETENTKNWANDIVTQDKDSDDSTDRNIKSQYFKAQSENGELNGPIAV